MIRDRAGMALIITMMALALITALTVEFTYNVYCNLNYLENWKASQELSLSAKSGLGYASGLIVERLKTTSYSYPGKIIPPPVDLFMDGSSIAGLEVTDETGKFNLNSLVYQNGKVNDDAARAFKRMLKSLKLDESVAELVVDWIDSDNMPSTPGGERGARNAPMRSVDELLAVGVERDVYDILVSYVTVYGMGLININGAEAPVLMSLEGMDEERAARIVSYRDTKAFERTSDITKVPGFDSGLGTSMIGKITVKGDAFRMTATVETRGGIKSIADCVMDTDGTVKYWREM